MLLEVTSRCEQPCPDCGPARGETPEAGHADCELEALRGALPALRPLGIATLVLTGGEPILHPRFDELLALVSREGFRIGLRSHGWHAAAYVRALESYRGQLDAVWLTLRSHVATDAGARILEAIDAYRAAGHAVTVDHIVDRQTLGSLVALGERLAGTSITLHLRAPASAEPGAEALQPGPEVMASLVPQIHALKRILNERIALEPSLGFNHTYSFCNNFVAMDTAVLRANGDVVFCHRCPPGDPSGVLGNAGAERPSTILGRHPRRVGAIWSARLAAMATEAPGMSNNCERCLAALRSTAR